MFDEADPKLILRAQELFDAVCDLPPHEREAALAVADRDTSRIVRELLAAESAHGERLDRPALGDAPSKELRTTTPARIGPYAVLERIGTGGMGAVYRARGGSPEREVAIKVLRSVAASDDTLRRFENEARLLARLDHPAIARVFEAGRDDISGHGEESWFAMELVDGQPFNRFVRTSGYDRDAVVRLVAEIADAVHHANARGIVHRDLKPGNVLVTADGRPKVLDFGLARTVASAEGGAPSLESMHTRSGDVLGTLGTMSPEQLSGDGSKVDARTDVYALGVMAYEALSGAVPLDVASLPPHEAARVVRETDPVPLGQRDRALGGDLETVVMKALAKEPERRYRTAAQFGADLVRVLADEPIAARPPSTWYQATKFARRNRAFVTGLGAVFVALAIGVAVSTKLYLDVEEQRGAAVLAKDDADAARAEAVEQRDATEAALLDARAARAEAETALRDAETARAEAEAARDDERAARLMAERSSELRKKTIDEFVSVIAAPTPWTEGTDVLLVDALDTAANRARATFPDDPALRSEFLSAFIETFNGLGDWERAYEFAVEAHALAVEGNGHPISIARLEVELGTLESLLGDASGLDRALAGLARLDELAAPDVTVLRAINEIVEELQKRGSLRESLELCERALELAARVEDEYPSSAFSAHKAYGDVLMRFGEFDRALEVLEHALELAREADLPMQEVLTRNSIGAVKFQTGRYEEAHADMLAVLEGTRATGGTEHRFYLTQLGNLATVESQLAMYDAAIERLEEVIEVAERIEGRPSRTAALYLSNLTESYRRRGDHDAAVATGLRAVDELAAAYGRETLETTNGEVLAAKALIDVGRADEALPLLEHAIAWKTRELAEGHPSLADDNLWLAQGALLAERFELARDAAHAARTRGRAVPRPIGGLLAMADQTHAIATALAGDAEAARELAEAAVAFTAEATSPTSWVQNRARAIRILVDALAAGDASLLDGVEVELDAVRAVEGAQAEVRLARLEALVDAVRDALANS